MLQSLRDPLKVFTDFALEPVSYIVFAVDGRYYAKNGSTGMIEFSDTDATKVIQYAIDNAKGVIVVKEIPIPAGLQIKVPIIHVDEDYAIYTPKGIILSPDVYRRMVLYIKDMPVNLVNGEVFAYSNILFDRGWIRINRGGYMRSTSRLYTAEMPWRNYAVDVGGWCWFNHPNIVYANGYIFLAYVGVTETVNNVFASMIAKIDPSTGSVSTYVLWDGVDSDHATPSLDVLPDGRLVVAVSKHSGTVIRVAISNNPYDISSWTAKDIDLSGKLVNNNVTYPVPIVLGSTIYVFFRDGPAGNSIWRYIYSVDGGVTWSDPVTFLTPPSGVPAIYVLLTRVGSKVYFAANLAFGGVDVPKKNVYFFYFDGSAFYRANGTKIADAGTSFTPEQADKVFDSDAYGFYGAWSYDVYADASGNPIIAFAVFKKIDARLYQHFYYVARWDGTKWVVNQVADKGELHPIIANEYLYSGGIWIMRSDPSKVVVSRKRGMGWGVEIRDLSGSLITVVKEPEEPYEMNIHPVESNGYIFFMSGSYAEKNVLQTYILSNTPISTVPRTILTFNRDFVLALWLTMEPDMDTRIRHVTFNIGYYAIRFNNLKLEIAVWGTNLISPTNLSVGEHHALLEYRDAWLYAYLDGSLYSYSYRRPPTMQPSNAGWALEIGYRTGFSPPEWWGRVRDIILIYGRVGKATKLALYNTKFYGGIVMPELTVNKGVATIPANSTRVTVKHYLTTKPSKILITPLSQPPGKLWVENITSTSFDIVSDVAPTADLNVAWYAEV
jgi:hypothetical protein